jgi:hypothetical protein
MKDAINTSFQITANVPKTDGIAMREIRNSTDTHCFRLKKYIAIDNEKNKKNICGKKH